MKLTYFQKSFYLLTAVAYSMSITAGKKDDRVDFIIVGCGTAGSVMARNLSNNFNKKVVVFNDGLSCIGDPRVETPVPIFGVNAFDKQLSVSTLIPDPCNGFDLLEQYSSGNCLGGSSAHNFLLAVRGTYDIYNDIFLQTGDPRWSTANVLSVYKSFEFYTSATVANPVERCSTPPPVCGPLYITQFQPSFTVPLNPLLVDAWNINNPEFIIQEDYNLTNTPIGAASPQTFLTPLPIPLRSYAISAFLTPGVIINATPDACGALYGIDGRQLTIFTETPVTKIIFEGNKAVGVEYVTKFGQCKKAYAKCAVILSAGVPFSAQLLQLSGVGNDTVLQSVGIKPRVSSSLVGDGLHVNYGIQALVLDKASAYFNPTTTVAFADGSSVDPVNFPPNPTVRRFEMIPHYGLIPPLPIPSESVCVNNAAGDPELFAATVPLTPVSTYPTGQNVILFLGWNVTQSAQGSAFIISSSPKTWPQILYNCYQDGPVSQKSPASDAYKAVTMFKLVKQVVDLPSSNLELLFPPADHFPPDFGGSGSDELLFQDAQACLLNSGATITNHYTGTCQIGTDITNGVVGSDGHVFGTKNLYVADASVYPVSPTGNTCLPAYLAGELISQAVIERYG